MSPASHLGVKPSATTLALLEDIERRIDPEVEEDFKDQWRTFLYGGFKGEIFTPSRQKLSPPTVPLPAVHINDAIEDLDLMMQMQLAGVSASLNLPTLSPCLRANYGTGIMSTLFGAELVDGVIVTLLSPNTVFSTSSFSTSSRLKVKTSSLPFW